MNSNGSVFRGWGVVLGLVGVVSKNTLDAADESVL